MGGVRELPLASQLTAIEVRLTWVKVKAPGVAAGVAVDAITVRELAMPLKLTASTAI